MYARVSALLFDSLTLYPETMAKKQNPTAHRMTRRSQDNDYTQPGMYHVTLHVADGMGRPFGRVTGDASRPDGSADAPHVELTAIGRMVEHELLNSIRTHYNMVEVQDYVVMPEHLHFIIEVHAPIVSTQGRPAHLGQVIAGFKKGCNRRYWALTGQTAGGDSADGDARRGKPAGTDSGGEGGADGGARRGKPAGTDSGGSCPAVFPQGSKVPSRCSTGRPVLFASGYVDVMPLHSGQLQVQRQYIRNNPRSRLLRSSHRDVLQLQRGGIDTALSIKALMKYLQRECTPWKLTAAATAQIENRLLTRASDARRGKPAGTDSSGEGSTDDDARRGKPAGTDSGGKGSTDSGGEGSAAGGGRNGIIYCDSYGNRTLLTRRMLPVICHRRDAPFFATQKARCLKAAEDGAVLVSARIAKGEQEIIDTALAAGMAVVLVMDNGMTDRYHPSAARLEQCLAGRLLIVTPWQYHYMTAEEDISEVMCKTMNCVVQALCRMKDDWWKT